jgi:hypothetical protein
MMMHHRPHWIAHGIGVALVLLLLALVAHEARGQDVTPPKLDASAMFQGRPELAGAQGGLGAQAGVPQGGIGVQGSEAAGLNLTPPRVIREAREAKAQALQEFRQQRETEIAQSKILGGRVVASNDSGTDILVLPR